MICFRDTTFCISPNCRNECGRKLTDAIRAAATQRADGGDWVFLRRAGTQGNGE